MADALPFIGAAGGGALGFMDAQNTNRSARASAQSQRLAYQANQANISARRSLALQSAATKFRRAASTSRLIASESGLGGKGAGDRAASIGRAASLETKAIQENANSASTEAFLELESALDAIEARMVSPVAAALSGGAQGLQTGSSLGKLF